MFRNKDDFIIKKELPYLTKKKFCFSRTLEKCQQGFNVQTTAPIDHIFTNPTNN